MQTSMPPVGDLPKDLWIFGYGSLIWKNDDVPHTQSKVCFAGGYKRRAWQGSTDHRGTLEAPGRVVSMYSLADFNSMNVAQMDAAELLPESEDSWNVCGVAYKVTPKHRDKVCRSVLTFRDVCLLQPCEGETQRTRPRLARYVIYSCLSTTHISIYKLTLIDTKMYKNIRMDVPTLTLFYAFVVL